MAIRPYLKRVIGRDRHGMSRSVEYRAWLAMMQRCYNPNHSHFRHYGGRGITVCKRWKLSFRSFINDMGMRPAGMSLDRINNDGNYEPDNCQWATKKQQMRNRQNSVVLEHKGKQIFLFDLPPEARSRYHLGWPVENILSGVSPNAGFFKPLQKLDPRPSNLKEFCLRKKAEGFGMRQIGELLGVSRQRVEQILKRAIEDASANQAQV